MDHDRDLCIEGHVNAYRLLLGDRQCLCTKSHLLEDNEKTEPRMLRVSFLFIPVLFTVSLGVHFRIYDKNI